MGKYVNDDNLLYLWQKIKTLLGDKVDKVDGKELSDENFTEALKNKLASISPNAEVNAISAVTVNGTAVTPTNKVVNIDLTNYAKKTDITSMYRVKGNITWAELIAKTDAAVGDVYNVTDKGGSNYVCITAGVAGESSWDKLGDIVDLSIYDTSAQVDAKLAALPVLKVLDSATVNIYELDYGVYTFKEGVKSVLYYKPGASTDNLSSERYGSVLIVGEQGYNVNGQDIPGVRSYMILASRYDRIYYGHAHTQYGVHYTFDLSKAYITNTVSDLTNYYKKTETYTQTEVNNKIKVVDDKVAAFVAMTNEEIDEIVNG